MKNLILLFLFVLFAGNFQCLGQGSKPLEVMYNADGKIQFALFDANTSSQRPMSKSASFLREKLQMQDFETFRLIESGRDELGILHETYQLFYNGILVEGAVYKMHGKEGVESMNGTFPSIKIASVSPRMNKNDAIAAALRYVQANKYAWDNDDSKNYPKPELLICKNMVDEQGNWELAWKMQISAADPFISENVFVSAASGSIINVEPLICNYTGTAYTKYSGVKQITTDLVSGNYWLQETRNGILIKTVDNLNNGADALGNAHFIWDADNL